MRSNLSLSTWFNVQQTVCSDWSRVLYLPPLPSHHCHHSSTPERERRRGRKEKRNEVKSEEKAKAAMTTTNKAEKRLRTRKRHFRGIHPFIHSSVHPPSSRPFARLPVSSSRLSIRPLSEPTYHVQGCGGGLDPVPAFTG